MSQGWINFSHWQKSVSFDPVIEYIYATNGYHKILKTQSLIQLESEVWVCQGQFLNCTLTSGSEPYISIEALT